MRILSLRLIVSLILGITLVSVLSSYYEVQVEEHGLRRDLGRRAAVLEESLSGNVERSLEQATPGDLQRLVERFGNREHLAGIAVYDVLGNRIAITPALAELLSTEPPTVAQAIRDDRGEAQFTRAGTASIHIYALPLHNSQHQIEGGLAIVNDTGYIAAQTRRVWRETFLRVLAEMVMIALVTLLIIRWSLSGPIARAAQWMRALRTGRASARHSAVPDWDVFQPLAREVATFAESLKHARSAAETEAQLREAAESIWTADRLSVHLRSKLGNSRLIAVSNREPYFHSRRGKKLELVVPASGLVTFVQIAAPSRTHIQRYHDFLDEVEAEAMRINQRFQTANWRPIIFLKRQHSHNEIHRYYRAADLCMVTSLHDGMNLVAKEFLAARDDEDGVLILSRFTGAARELRDALLVNPYDIDGTADAIRRALAMDPDERKLRMQRMRKFISEHNIYRWAGTLIAELCEVRTDTTGKKPEEVQSGLSAV